MSEAKRGDGTRFVKMLETVFAKMKGDEHMTEDQKRIANQLDSIVDEKDCTLDNIRAIIDGTYTK